MLHFWFQSEKVAFFSLQYLSYKLETLQTAMNSVSWFLSHPGRYANISAVTSSCQSNKRPLRPWQTRTHCCGHIVADKNVSLFACARNICCGHKFCVRDTKNVSETNVSQFAQPRKHHGQQCVRNNVSSFTGAFNWLLLRSRSSSFHRPKAKTAPSMITPHNCSLFSYFSSYPIETCF